jgi:hypothetical protein
VRAAGSDREHLGAAPDQQDLFAADMTDERLAFGQLGQGDASGQIGTRGFVPLVCHCCLLVAAIRH